jgi:hypothetical protein
MYGTDSCADGVGKTPCCQLVWVQVPMVSQHVQVKQGTKASQT